MAISISTLTQGSESVTTLVSGNKTYNKYTVTGAELTNAGSGIKLVSGSIEVEQHWHATDASQGFFYIEESNGTEIIPLTSPSHSVNLVIFDDSGDGNSIPITLTRTNVTTFDVVAASAQLTAPSIFEKFVSQGATITDGQQLQYQSLDDSENSVSYNAAGIGTFGTAGRSTHRVCLWNNGELLEEYVNVDNSGLAGKPNIAASLVEQSAAPIYDGRSPDVERPSVDRPYGASLWNINELSYVGACKIPYGTYNDGAIQYNEHQNFHYDNARNSIFIAGGRVSVQEGNLMVGEFSLPTLLNSTDFDALPSATNAQPFRDVFADCVEGNTANLDRITGIYSNGSDSELIVNAIVWYDTNTRSETTVCVMDKTNIAASTINGLYDLASGRAGSGWVSEVPLADRAAFGSTHFNGYAANDSIDSSQSHGPAAFGLNLTEITQNAGSNGVIPQTDEYMFYPYSVDGSTSIMGVKRDVVVNAIYNKTTKMRTAFFIPNTDTFMVVGENPSLWWGEQYKIINDAGELSNGDAPNVKRDRRNYYWLFKKSDMLDAKNGVIDPWDIEPYDFGVLDLPFQEVADERYMPDGFSAIRGASFDPITNRLYMILGRLGTNGATDRALVCYEV